MRSIKTITALCFVTALCTAQTINIRGTVHNKSGVGLSGATVKLENAGLSATTSADGSFTLTYGPAAILAINNDLLIGTGSIRLQRGRIEFSLSENTLISVAVFDIVGKQYFSLRRMCGCGTHHLSCPVQAGGIHFIRVKFGEEMYSFRMASWGTLSGERRSIPSNSTVGAPAKQVKASAVIADVIAVRKEGLIDYRDSIRTSDTSGIVIKMIANAGNVTDAGGNVYQSVRIGDQVWTVQNLRTTKFNDGTAIPLVTVKTTWESLSTPGYCFYENRTDTAYQRKWGALYNWHSVKTGKLAPAGWRVPTQADWTTLENYLIANRYNWDGTTTENKIAKSMGAQTDWPPCPESWCIGAIANEPGSNNRSGFSAFPGGTRGSGVGFMEQGEAGHWWSDSSSGSSSAYSRSLRSMS